MASKRKATTPCMIPPKALALESDADIAEGLKEEADEEETQEAPALISSHNEVSSNGHQNINGERFFCKYCNFGSQDTSRFVEHMNTKHPDFRDDPSYVCIACSFLVNESTELEAHNTECHPRDAGLTWTVAKHESYTVVEQSVSDRKPDGDVTDSDLNQSADDYSEITFTKTPIMKTMKNKAEAKKIVAGAEKVEKKNHLAAKNLSVSASKPSTGIANASPIVNGSILGTVPVLPGVTQLVSINPSQPVVQPKIPTIIAPVLTKQSTVQKPQGASQSSQLPNSKSLPKVMIPLSSIPTYNISMDSNSFLKNSFNKFPYPTKAELCYLTVVTKYPEEQIKIWFTAQRLKQGISWSPEEIEDSRKKMFNTVIQSIPQPMPQPTITVLNAPLVANANGVQHLIQAALPGQIVGQPQGTGGLLVTQPIITNGIRGSPSSVSLTVTSLPTQHTTTQARVASPAAKDAGASEATTSTSPSLPSQSLYDFSFSRSKKSRQQLGALKNSFYRNQFPTPSEVNRLTKITGLTTRDVRKWFSDKRYHWRNKSSYAADSSDGMIDSPSEMYSLMKDSDLDFTLGSHAPSHTSRRQSWNQTPDFTPTKYKERAPEQIKALERSFFQSNFPSEDEVNRLRSETKMTRREIDSWFADKRKKLAVEHKKLDMEEDEENMSYYIKVSDVPEPSAENNPQTSERKVNPIKINLKDLRVTESNESVEAPVDDNGVGSDGSSRPSTPLKNRSHIKKTAQQRDLLKQTFVKTQSPSSKEYDDLAEQTGLPRADIVRWFGDSRYSFKNGQLKWYERYKGIVGIKTVTPHPLMQYYEQHHQVSDHDLASLCETTGMTPDEVRVWFAEKQETANQAVSGATRDNPSDDGTERPDPRVGNSEFESKSSVHREPESQKTTTDPTHTVQQSSIPREAD
ncbi:zinc fingers and homeoboxes protein 3 [Spea bombifrons]|uniref:zinc fingers and homeoboxes protein 3 n=1 Tax=Spea bombifrons TaxID=233779 RepID=UPI00234A09BA|nr:zinc fingers and homeoboxes protein 3 [Spea bombifrons]XP_053309768.1 zinc fingers and homeoboxes protein 3 [Spea bombifrons]